MREAGDHQTRTAIRVTKGTEQERMPGKKRFRCVCQGMSAELGFEGGIGGRKRSGKW